MKETSYKIFVFTLPFHGHLNPILCFSNELNKLADVHVFGCTENKEIIQKTGVEFRNYSDYSKINFDTEKPKYSHFGPGEIINILIDITDSILPNLAKLIEIEQPDLIITDAMAYFTKCLFSYMENNYKKGISNAKLPPSIIFNTSFASQNEVFPNTIESKLYQISFDFVILFKVFIAFLKQLILNYKYGLSIYNLIGFLFGPSDKPQITSIFPELQPRHHLFRKQIKFVGSCFNDQVRHQNINDDKLSEVLNMFKPSNPDRQRGDDQAKLIYVSLGTVFHEQMAIFEKIIEAINQINEDKSNLKVIISVGDNLYNKFMNKIKNEGYKISDNILLRPFVPQLEILKRASLFITHAGMNSTSESIHYGVPVICIPIAADQNVVSYRVCDELGMGLRLNKDKITVKKIRESIYEILNDRSYSERVFSYSQISRKYNGNINGANYAIQVIEESKNMH